jgi:hypothetical protein
VIGKRLNLQRVINVRAFRLFFSPNFEPKSNDVLTFFVDFTLISLNKKCIYEALFTSAVLIQEPSLKPQRASNADLEAQ